MATGIGETLRAARRQQGVALADAAAETRVRETYLAALESEDFAALGGDVYVKGFLRSYARFLRLDPEPLLATYRAEFERPSDDIGSLAHAPAYPVSSERRSGVLVWAAVAVLILAVFGAIGLVNRDEPAEVPLAAPSPVATEPAPAATTEPEPEQTEEPADEEPATADDPTETVAGDGVRLELDIGRSGSWMRVIVDGVEQFEGIQPQGTSVGYEAQESITVRIGDAGAVAVYGQRPGPRARPPH